MNISGKLPYLRIICNYSDDCNFRCRWCHHEGVYSGTPRRILTPEEIASVAEKFYRIGVRKYKILGGEPTLRNDLGEIIHRLRLLDQDMDISIVTNGHRLTEKIEEYKASGLTRVNVSLFTLDENYFQKNVGNAALLQKVIDGIDQAADMKMLSKINHIYHDQDDLKSIVDFAAERNVRVNLLNEIPTSKGGRFTEIDSCVRALNEIGIDKAEIEEDPFSLPVIVYKLKNGVSVEIKHLTISNQCLFDSCRSCKQREKCKEGIFALRLTPEGKIAPCLVRTDNSFDVLEKTEDEFMQYLQQL